MGAQAISIHWTAQTSGVTARLRGVSAVNERVVWASGADGTILRTADGGQTWQRQSIPGAEKLDFRDIDALSETIAYALSIGAGDASRIYKTTDAGAHWTLQFTNDDPKAFYDAMAFWDGSFARIEHFKLNTYVSSLMKLRNALQDASRTEAGKSVAYRHAVDTLHGAGRDSH